MTTNKSRLKAIIEIAQQPNQIKLPKGKKLELYIVDS